MREYLSRSGALALFDVRSLRSPRNAGTSPTINQEPNSALQRPPRASWDQLARTNGIGSNEKKSTENYRQEETRKSAILHETMPEPRARERPRQGPRTRQAWSPLGRAYRERTRSSPFPLSAPPAVVKINPALWANHPFCNHNGIVGVICDVPNLNTQKRLASPPCIPVQRSQ
jgi:hypothetical protein